MSADKSVLLDPETKATRGRASVELPADQWNLRVVLRQGEGGRELATELASAADVLDLQCELWRDQWLRKGQPDTPLDSLRFRLMPSFVDGDETRCEGFLLRGVAPDGKLAARDFTSESLAGVAARQRQAAEAD